MTTPADAIREFVKQRRELAETSIFSKCDDFITDRETQLAIIERLLEGAVMGSCPYMEIAIEDCAKLIKQL